MYLKLMGLWRALIDILHRKYLKLAGKPVYPYIILPKPSFVNPINFDTLFQESDVILTRRVDLEIEEVYDPVSETLKSSVFAKQDIPGMSLNILGGLFQVDFNQYKTTGTASDEWNNCPVYLTDYLKDYQIITSNFTSIYFKSSDLHHIDVPFIREQNHDSIKFYASLNRTPDMINGKYQLNGNLFLEHKPTNLNYWHAELAFIDVEGHRVDRKIKASQKKAADYVIDHILCVAGNVLVPVSFPPVNRSHYIFV
jgi:hypothetical protein